MLKIEETTTILELELELTRLGVTSMRVYSTDEHSSYVRTDPTHRWATMLVTQDRAVISYGTGVTIGDSVQIALGEHRKSLLKSYGFDVSDVMLNPAVS